MSFSFEIVEMVNWPSWVVVWIWAKACDCLGPMLYWVQFWIIWSLLDYLIFHYSIFTLGAKSQHLLTHSPWEWEMIHMTLWPCELISRNQSTFTLYHPYSSSHFFMRSSQPRFVSTPIEHRCLVTTCSQHRSSPPNPHHHNEMDSQHPVNHSSDQQQSLRFSSATPTWCSPH